MMCDHWEGQVAIEIQTAQAVHSLDRTVTSIAYLLMPITVLSSATDIVYDEVASSIPNDHNVAQSTA